MTTLLALLYPARPDPRRAHRPAQRSRPRGLRQAAPLRPTTPALVRAQAHDLRRQAKAVQR